MKQEREIYRQGDVLIEEIGALPKGLTRREPEDGRIILARGEATGHHHSLDIDAADWWKDDKGGQFLTVTDPAAVTHQEHDTIVLPPGNFRVRRQREYTPEAIRTVAD